MATLSSCKDYGFRKVATVLLNPSAAAYTHEDSSAHPAENTNGCVDTERGVPGCHVSQRFIDVEFEASWLLAGEAKQLAEIQARCVEEGYTLTDTSITWQVV
jgi:hypothetical protein